MATRAIQTRFDGGEISPRLRGRFDSDIYKISLDFCENWIPQAQGSLRLRPGTVHVRGISGRRLLPVRVVSGQDFLVELADHALSIYAIDGFSAIGQEIVSNELVTDGDFDAWPTGWTVKSQENASVTLRVPGGGLFFERYFSFEPAWIRQKITVADNASLAVTLVSGTSNDASQVRVRIGTSEGGGDVLDWQGPAGPIRLEVPAVAAGEYWLSVEIPWEETSTYDPTVTSFWLISASVVATYINPLTSLPTPWSAGEVGDVRHAAETGRDRILFAHPNHPPYHLTRNAGSWDFGTVGTGAAVFVNKPAEWDGDAWPGVVEIHAGRAWWSGHPVERNRVWASRVGTLFDFSTATGSGGEQLPGDAIDFKIATPGAVRWMKSSRALLAGTDLGEHSISGSKGVPLNGDIHVRPESHYGSAPAPAVDAGGAALYLSTDRRKVRAIAYDYRTAGWESRDVAFAAEHITSGGVREVHHAFTPEPAIFLVMASGSLRGCTYAPEEGVVAWWRLTPSSGLVRSAAVSRGDQGAFLWLAVERDGEMYLERLPLGDSAADPFLDASVARQVASDGFLYGLAHLEGRTVRVVIRDNFRFVLGDRVVTAGRVECGKEWAGKDAAAGLPYRGVARTLPKDVRGGRVSSGRIGVILNLSALPALNGRRPPERRPSEGFQGVQPRTGKVEVSGAGWDDEGQIEIIQDLPLRTEILALYETVQANDL